jgi:hypothetical protein
MDAIRSAAAFAAGALVSQYGVRGTGTSAHALSTTAASHHAAAIAPALPPPSQQRSSASSSPSSKTRLDRLDRLASSLLSLESLGPYLQAAAAVAAAGAVAAAAHAAAAAVCSAISKQLTFEAEVDSRDDAYRWLMLWLSRHRALSKASRVSVTTSLRAFGASTDCALEEGAGADNGDDGNDDNEDDDSVKHPPPVALLPAPGTHLLWHNGRLFMVSRRRAPGNPHSPSNARLLSETLVIRTPRNRGGGRAAVLALLSDARDAYKTHTSGSTLIYSVDSSACYWEAAGARPRRPLASVVLPGENDGANLLADARRFLASGRWYASRGIPHRRGYLLQGPPGSGKSSLVAALAAELGLSIFSVTLSSPLLTDDGLRSLLNAAGTKGVLLLEDIDAAFGSRVNAAAAGDGKNGGGSSSALTLAGLLNALDGVAAQEGRLLFLTTNHPERLDPALVRPGRVDVRVSFAKASRSQLRRLFARFFFSDGAVATAGSSSSEALAERFANALPEGELSLAEVQGLLLLHRDDPRAAVEAAEKGALRASTA